MLSIDNKINYKNFGYIPEGRLLKDIYGKLFGHPNLFKRLQAPDVIRALAPGLEDVILDFGCGSGYMTVELAKVSKKTIGIDINANIGNIRIPKSLDGQLEYVISRGENLPFEENQFDKVLLSEVIATIEEPDKFLAEIKRVLKPGGILVVCNGTGPVTLEESFNNEHESYRAYRKKYPETMPASFTDYKKILSRGFGNLYKDFYKLDDIQHIMKDNDFIEVDHLYSPGKKAGHLLAIQQLESFLSEQQANPRIEFIKKYRSLFKLSQNDNNKYPGGLIYVAKNSK